jgi:hypothetical protein
MNTPDPRFLTMLRSGIIVIIWILLSFLPSCAVGQVSDQSRDVLRQSVLDSGTGPGRRCQGEAGN